MNLLSKHLFDKKSQSRSGTQNADTFTVQTVGSEQMHVEDITTKLRSTYSQEASTRCSERFVKDASLNDVLNHRCPLSESSNLHVSNASLSMSLPGTSQFTTNLKSISRRPRRNNNLANAHEITLPIKYRFVRSL